MVLEYSPFFLPKMAKHVTKRSIEPSENLGNTHDPSGARVKFIHTFSMKDLMVLLFFAKKIFTIKLSIKILEIICMTSQMTIRFKGNCQELLQMMQMAIHRWG